jgi:hypothetical protein
MASPLRLVGTRSRAIRRGTSISANKRHICSARASGHVRSRKRASLDVPRRIARERVPTGDGEVARSYHSYGAGQRF